MSITSRIDGEGRELIIAIDGRFDFSSHQSFRQSYEGYQFTPESYLIDLSETTYMDSSALGMLLLLRDHAGGDRARIRLAHSNPDVRKVLSISNFEQLFSID